MAYQLTQKAEEDIIRIYAEGLRLFGTTQAEAYHNELSTVFDLLSLNPRMARERKEIRPAVRIHPHGSHIIVYRIDQDGSILIIRLRHAHEDWESNL